MLQIERKFCFLTDFSNIIFISNGIVVSMFANGPGDRGSILGRIISKTKKWYLIPPMLNTQNDQVQIKRKWSNPGKRVAPSLTPQCSTYSKGSLRIALDNGRLTYLWTYF